MNPSLLDNGDVMVFGADPGQPRTWGPVPSSSFGGGDPLTAGPPLDITDGEITITPGADGQVLTTVGGVPEWATLPPGGGDPLTAVPPLDITDGEVTIEAGAVGQVLTTTAPGEVGWAAPAAGAVTSDGVTITGDGTGGNPLAVTSLGAANGDVLTADGAAGVYWQAPPPASVTTLTPLAGSGTGVGDEVRIENAVNAGELLYWDGVSSWLHAEMTATAPMEVDAASPNPPNIRIIPGTNGQILTTDGTSVLWDTLNTAPDAYLVAELQAAVTATPSAPQGALADQTADFVTAVVFPRLLVSHSSVWFWSLNFPLQASASQSLNNSSGLVLGKTALATTTTGFLMYVESILVRLVDLGGAASGAGYEIRLEGASTVTDNFDLATLFPGAEWAVGNVAEVSSVASPPVVLNATEVLVYCPQDGGPTPIVDVYVKASIMPYTP